MRRSGVRVTVFGLIVLVLLAGAAGAQAAGPVVKTGSASNIWATTAVLNGSVDSSLPLTSCKFTYGQDPALVVGAASQNCQFVSNSDGVYAVLKGLSPVTTYYYRLSASSAAGTSMGSTRSFTTSANPPPPPQAQTYAATDVTDTSATLNAVVNAEDVAVTGCTLQYGTSTSYGQSAPCSPPPTSGKNDQPESAQVSGLTEGTTYHFRVVFSTEGGTATGDDQTFVATSGTSSSSAVGSATTGTPKNVTSSGATLTGTVNAGGQSGDTCAFYYGVGGATATYQLSVPCSTATVPASGDQAESAAVSRLKPGTQYHYVIVLMTSAGPVIGSPVTFTTAAYAAPTGTTGRASKVSRKSAVLNARVNAHGAPVLSCVFQYSRSRLPRGPKLPRSAHQARCRPAPSGSANVAVRATIAHLASSKRYYFRVILVTKGGTLVGATHSFKTRKARRRARRHR